MKIKVKRLSENSILPSYAKLGDAGLDLTAITKEYDEYGNISYGTGLSFEIPQGYVGLLFPRSSNSKTDLYLTNHVGVLDSGYRGEVSFKYRNLLTYIKPEDLITNDFKSFKEYAVGDRIGQLIILPYPQIEFEEVEELSETERGAGNYGSSGN